MARYARLDHDHPTVVREIIILPDGWEISSVYTPEFSELIHPCGADVAEGWTFDGSAFHAPTHS